MTPPEDQVVWESDDEAPYRLTRGQDRTESDERDEMAPVDADAATRAREARYAEAIDIAACGSMSDCSSVHDRSKTFAVAVVTVADAEQAELRAEVERLRAQIEAGGGATQHWRAEAYRMGARVEVAEAKLADPWGLEGNAAAKAWRKKADAAEAELRALGEGTLRVERYAQAQAVTAHARGSESERDWLDVIALLAPSPAATTGEAAR